MAKIARLAKAAGLIEWVRYVSAVRLRSESYGEIVDQLSIGENTERAYHLWEVRKIRHQGQIINIVDYESLVPLFLDSNQELAHLSIVRRDGKVFPNLNFC